MRRLMWYGAMAALVGAAGFYLAADYANRYPNSLLGQCVVTGYQVGTVNNPVARAGGASVERTFEAIKEVMDRPGMAPTTVPIAPADPDPLGPEAAPCPDACRKPEALPEPRMLGHVVIQPDADEPPGDQAPAGPAAGGAEEAEVPPPMPPARDDNDVPPKMPYADDQAQEHGPDRVWDLLVHPTDVAPAEECEPAPPATGDCREDPNYDRHYPGCPHMGSCPDSAVCPHPGKCPSCDRTDPVVEEKAVPNHTQGGAEEQSAPPVMPDLPKGAPQAKSRKHRDVDTTEFRPSDGKPFDFGSFPY